MAKNRILVLILILITISAAYYFFKKTRFHPEQKSTITTKTERSNLALRNEIRSKQQKTDLHVLLIGWDAADWQIAEPLMNSGRLPTLKKLVNSGTRAFLHSYSPMLSPLLWNSIATGKYPTQHGILDFLVVDPQTHKTAPINSSFRKCMALWNILSEADRKNAWVAWWATWPAEPVNGVMITDRVSYSLFSNNSSTDSTGFTWPEKYYREIKPKLISEKEITNEQLAQFVNLSPSEISQQRLANFPEGKTNPLSYLARVLASTLNYYTISKNLLIKDDFELFSCYFEGIDQVGHLFQHCMKPKMNLASDEEYQAYKDVVPRFYEFVDQLTGDIIQHSPQHTVVILVSDHGFKNGASRPVDLLPYISERPAYWHREYGIFVISGDPIGKNRQIDTVKIFDLAPTILYLLGLPVGKDLPGKVLTASFESSFLEKYPEQSIASWEPLKVQASNQSANSNVDSEVLENLAALGYIGQAEKKMQPLIGKETAAYHRNLATIYLHEKKFDLAQEEIEKSMSLGTAFETYELMFQILKTQGKPEEAATALKQGLQHFQNAPPESYFNLIEMQISQNHLEDAETTFQNYGSQISSQKYCLECSGILKEAKGDFAGAEKDYLAALEIDPSFGQGIDRLYKFYRSHDELEKLENVAQKGLEINDQLAVCHNVLGVIHKKRAHYVEAIREYEKALSLDPDNSTYLANLGATYLSMQKPQTALDILLRAKNKDENDPEVWINLGAIYGTLGKNDEGLAAFQKAKELGIESPNVEVGIAAIYAQKGNNSEAIHIIEKALIKYPKNQDLNDLLAMVKQQ